MVPRPKCRLAVYSGRWLFLDKLWSLALRLVGKFALLGLSLSTRFRVGTSGLFRQVPSLAIARAAQKPKTERCTWLAGREQCIRLLPGQDALKQNPCAWRFLERVSSGRGLIDDPPCWIRQSLLASAAHAIVEENEKMLHLYAAQESTHSPALFAISGWLVFCIMP